jgi:hypothetical protein
VLIPSLGVGVYDGSFYYLLAPSSFGNWEDYRLAARTWALQLIGGVGNPAYLLERLLEGNP